MAFVLGDLGRHQDARVASKRAIQLNPPLARAQTNLSLERYTAERKSQERRQRLAPEPQVVEGNELAHYNLGLAFRQKGYYNEALKEYRLALERGEDRRLTLQAMAELHLLKRDLAAALELYDTLLREVPDSPKLWNERGVVLHQAGRPEAALASYRPAVAGDTDHAGAHYNLSFTLSNLAGFDGGLPATKRALELDPYYVSQKFALTIDLQYEKGTIGIAPEISADVAAETIGEDFNFDQRLLDSIFQELAPPAAAEPPASKAADNPLALARDYVSKGLMDVAAAEAVRAVQRGASRSEAGVLLGDIFAKRGLHGEALERYREARSLEPGRADARLGEVKALFALGGPRADEARALAEELLELTPDNVDALVAAAKGRAAGGDAAGALTALQQAQTRAPGRADLHKLQGDIAVKVGDKAGALAAYRSALELDRGYVQVWLDLGRLHEEKEELSEARKAYERALDALPTFHEAALALADLLRRSGHVRAAIVRVAEMLEQDPYDLLALLLLGRALLDDRRDPQALEAFQRALKFDPDQVEALFQLGVALARLHRYGEAVQAWEKVTRTDPAGPFAQAARAHARTALDLKHIFASDAA